MGESNNKLYDLAKKAGIIGGKIEDQNSLYVLSDGEVIPTNLIDPHFDIFKEIITTNSERDELVSDIFEERVQQLETSSMNKTILTKLYKLFVESITPVTNWNNEIGRGLASQKTLDGSTGIDLKVGMNNLLALLMVCRIID